MNNDFIRELRGRSERQVAYTPEMIGEHVAEYGVGAAQAASLSQPRRSTRRVKDWEEEGFTEALRTPDSTLIFVTPEKAEEIHADQVDCMGCLSQCRFSNWSQHGADHDNGKKADPRSFCIQKTLQNIAHASDEPDAVDHNLMFSRAQRLSLRQGYVLFERLHSTVKQLVERILTGR